jgi:hypothetical protein
VRLTPLYRHYTLHQGYTRRSEQRGQENGWEKKECCGHVLQSISLSLMHTLRTRR